MALTLYPHVPQVRVRPDLTERHDALFFDPEKSLELLEPEQRQAVNGWLDTSDDREKDLRYLAVGGYLADVYGEADPAPDRREYLKSQYARNNLGVPDGAQLDDDTFYGMVKDERTKGKERRDLFSGVAQMAAKLSTSANSRLADEQREEFFKNAMTDPGYKPDDLPALWSVWRQTSEKARGKVNELMPLVDMTVQQMKAAGESPRGLSGVAETIAGQVKSQEDRLMLFELVRQKLAGVQDGKGGGLGEAGPASSKPDTAGSVEAVGSGLARGANNLGRNIGQAAENFFENLTLSKPGETKEEARDIEDRLAGIWQSGGAPLTDADSSVITKSLVGAAESVIPSFLIAGGPAGAAMTFANYHEESMDNFRAAGIDSATAANMATPAALAKSLLDRVQWKVLAKVPGVTKIEGALWGAASQGRYIAGQAAKGAGITALETGIEVVQGHYVEAAAQQVASWLSEGIKAPDWSDVWEKAAAETPDILLTMIPLTLIGTGAAGARDIQGAQVLASNQVLLRAAGFSGEQAAAITSAPDPVRTLRGMWSGREPGKVGAAATPGDVAASAVEAAQDVREEMQRSVEDAGDILNSTPGVTEVRRTGEGWQVTDDAGGTHTVASADAVAPLLMEIGRASSQAEAEAMVSIADTFAERDAEAGSKQEAIFTNKAVRAMQDGPGIAESLNQQLKALGMKEAVVEGSNWIAEDGTRMYQINQGSEGVLTQVHEFAEARFRDIAAADGGASAVAAARAIVPLFDPLKGSAEDKAFASRVHRIADGTASPIEMQETIVELAVANTLGKRKDGGRLPAGAISTGVDAAIRSVVNPKERAAIGKFRSMLRAVREYLRGVFGVAAKLTKARRDGKDLADLDALVDKMMGVDVQRRHEASVVKEATGRAPTQSLRSVKSLEAIAQKLENTMAGRKPKEKLSAFSRMHSVVSGMARAARHNESVRGVFSKEEKAAWDSKRMMVAYEAIVMQMPAELRGRMGGFAKLADYKTDAARRNFLLEKLDKAERLMEKYLQDQYREQIESIFARSEPKGGAGEKSGGKLGALGHAWMNFAKEAAGMNAAQTAKEIAGLEAQIAGDLSEDALKEINRAWGPDAAPDEEAGRALLSEQITILETFGGMDAMSAEDLARAFEVAEDAYINNRHGWIHTLLERKERRAALREKAITEAGGAHDPAKHNKARLLDPVIGFLDTHLSFEQMMGENFGVKSSTHGWTMKASRKSADAETDMLDARRREFASFLEGFGGKIARLNKLMALQKRQDTGIPGPAEHLSQLQAVHITMLARDENSAEWLSRHGWNTSVMEQLEEWLSDDAKAVRSFLIDQYDAQYDRINAVHARFKGVALPRVRNYAPRLVEHGGKQQDMALDPDNAAGMITGFLRRRFDSPQGPPKLADALQAFWANQTVVSHWVAWAETIGEFRGTIGSRDVRLSTETHRGSKAAKITKWLRDTEAGGVQEAIAATEVGSLLRRWFDARSKTALFGKLSVLIKQIPAALGSAAKVGPVQWMNSAARVLSGRSVVSLSEMFNSPVVQRRLNEGEEWMRPASKGAKNSPGLGIFPTAANVIDFTMGKAGGVIGYTDAAFTTFSAAVAHDAAMQQFTEAGLPEEEAARLAWERTAEVVGQTAQPQAMIDKSLLEVEWPTMGRLLFAFQGANRQAWSLMYQAVKNGKADPKQAAQVWALYAVVVPTIVYILGGLVKYATGDDDWEDEFSVKDWAKQIAAAQSQGLIVVGPAVEGFTQATPRQTDTPISSDASEGWRAFRKLIESDEEREARPKADRDFDAKDTGKILNGFSTALGGRASAIGVANNIFQQFMGARAATTEGDQGRESLQAKKNRAAAKKESKQAD